MKNDYLLKEDLKTILEGSNLTLKELSQKTGISLRTLNNIISNEVLPSSMTLEKIYSFAYDDGYRFNKIKEEIFKETKKEIILFHGSKDGLTNITYDGSRDNCDFGKGFYLGESYLQASMFVYDIPNSSVYSFAMNLDDLKIKKFECDLMWMITICYFRNMLVAYQNSVFIKKIEDEIKDADIIIAPIADNRMFNVMRQFGDGEITSKQAIHCLASSGLGYQYVLKTEKAISKLESIERLYISNSERKDFNNLMEERAKEIDTKLKISKREFRGEGQYIDEILK